MTKRTAKTDKARTAKIAKTIKDKTAQIHAERERKKERLTQGRPPKYKSARALAYKLAEYMHKCDNTIVDADKGKTEPYTLTGLQVAVGMDGGTYSRYEQGEHDHAIIDVVVQVTDGQIIEDNSRIYPQEVEYIRDCEQRDELRPYFDALYTPSQVVEEIYFSKVMQKARQLVQQQAELRLYMRGSVADIFTLKSKYGWQEEQTTVHRLEIATSEDARQALEELRLISG